MAMFRGPISELVYTDLIKKSDFDMLISDGKRDYKLSDIVEVVADGLSGESLQLEDDVEVIRKKIKGAILSTMMSGGAMANFNPIHISTTAGIITEYVIAKAFVRNENLKEG